MQITLIYIYMCVCVCVCMYKSDKRLILGALLHWRRSYGEINKVAAYDNNINI